MSLLMLQIIMLSMLGLMRMSIASMMSIMKYTVKILSLYPVPNAKLGDRIGLVS